MAYQKTVYITGKTQHVERRIPRKYQTGGVRLKKYKKTPEEIRKNNYYNTIRKLTRKMDSNFSGNDYHIVLTYRKDERPSPEQSRQITKKLLNILRKEYKKLDAVLKYVIVTEHINTDIHHHLIINELAAGCNASIVQMIKKLWTYGRPKSVPLDDNGSYHKLAAYLLKDALTTIEHPAFRQMYTCSRNLHVPEPDKEIILAKTWRKQPKAPKGYYIDPDSLVNSIDRMTGYPYQRYILVRLE